MKFTTAIATAAFAALATAAPLEKRADKCGQWDSIAASPYTLYNDLWGESGATSGSGCFGLDSISGNTIKWHSTYVHQKSKDDLSLT